MAVDLARALNLPDKDQVNVRQGALLHNIGMLGIPESILLKPQPLSEGERSVILQHPQFAYDWLSRAAYLRPSLDIPYCHHEQWDGNGYPRQLKGESIPLAARLFSVVHMWDALQSDRPYRKAWSRANVVQYLLQQSGVLFDPRLVKAFFDTFTGSKF
jgi:HD-GYP domain-containing protein (c-di-GMP phosphodiesterase class II)